MLKIGMFGDNPCKITMLWWHDIFNLRFENGVVLYGSQA